MYKKLKMFVSFMAGGLFSLSIALNGIYIYGTVKGLLVRNDDRF